MAKKKKKQEGVNAKDLILLITALASMVTAIINLTIVLIK